MQKRNREHDRQSFYAVLTKKEIPTESLFTTDSHAVPANEKGLLPDFAKQLIDKMGKEELEKERSKFEEEFKYEVVVTRERVNVHRETLILQKFL